MIDQTACQEPIPCVPVRAAPDEADFAQVRDAGVPVVFRGLNADWPAVTAGHQSDEAMAAYLSRLARPVATRTMVAPAAQGGRYFYDDEVSGFNYESRDIPAPATLAQLIAQKGRPDRLSIYAGAAPSSDLFPGFGAENPMSLAPPPAEPLVWFGNTARIAPHFDGSENLACAVRGTRRFLIFPPDQVSNLYPGPIDKTMAGQPASLVDPQTPDFARFPRYAEALATAQLAELEPGDVLYLPALWWHYVESEGDLCVLVNYWWRARDVAPGMTVLGLALFALRDAPAPERAAWSALFDHYVFGEDAQNAADHLPAAARGILGPPSPAREERMKAFLRAQLSLALR